VLCWDQTGPDATVNNRLCADGDDDEVADEHLVGVFGTVSFGGF